MKTHNQKKQSQSKKFKKHIIEAHSYRFACTEIPICSLTHVYTVPL